MNPFKRSQYLYFSLFYHIFYCFRDETLEIFIKLCTYHNVTYVYYYVVDAGVNIKKYTVIGGNNYLVESVSPASVQII